MKREEEKTGKYLAQRGKTEYMADSDGRKEYQIGETPYKKASTMAKNQQPKAP